MPTTRRIGLAYRPSAGIISGGKGTKAGASKNEWLQFVKPFIKTASKEYKKVKALSR